jgi:hypothetical protein
MFRILRIINLNLNYIYIILISDTCAKWRLLPSTVDVASLPDIWTCSMNIYDPELASCDAQEESYKESPEPKLVDFLKLWTKKLKDGDRAEGKLLHVRYYFLIFIRYIYVFI